MDEPIKSGDMRVPGGDYADPPGRYLLLSVEPFVAVDVYDGWTRVPEAAFLAARPLAPDEVDAWAKQRFERLKAKRDAARRELEVLDEAVSGASRMRTLLRVLRGAS